MRRLLAWVGIPLLALLVIVPSWYTASVALHPFTSVPIPAWCNGSVSHLPSTRASKVPGGTGTGTGTLLASTLETAVVVTAHYGRTPAHSTVRVVNRARDRVVRTLSFDDDVVAVAIQRGVVYLYNDAILYPIDGVTGAPIHGLVRIDNYRQLYVSDGGRRMQTSAAISTLGYDGVAFSQLHLHFATMASGCYFP